MIDIRISTDDERLEILRALRDRISETMPFQVILAGRPVHVFAEGHAGPDSADSGPRGDSAPGERPFWKDAWADDPDGEPGDLTGPRVTVTNPQNPAASWTGRVTGWYDEPVVILELDDGSAQTLPQRFAIEPADSAPRGDSGVRGDFAVLAAQAVGALLAVVNDNAMHERRLRSRQAEKALADARLELCTVLGVQRKDEPAGLIARKLLTALRGAAAVTGGDLHSQPASRRNGQPGNIRDYQAPDQTGRPGNNRTG